MTHLKNRMTRITAVLLAMLMVLTVAPLIALPAAAEDSSEFLRIFHLDCGRKYFSVSEIEKIIDKLAENHYTHIQLAFGNDGFRLVLNNMEITANGKTYASDTVKNAVVSGNATYSSGASTASTQLSESDMDTIIAYANEKGIEVIPMFNVPYHANALLNAMENLGISNVRKTFSNSNYLNLENDDAVNFILALQEKYISYFAGKGCTRYNFAADEYAFASIDNTVYTKFATFVNNIADLIINAGMTPMAYNDGFYFGSLESSVAFNNNIEICYWAESDNRASAATLASKDFKIINNSNNWYYVLGDYLYIAWGSNGQWGYSDAINGIKNTDVTTVKGDTAGSVTPIGSILCVWCDYPSVSYYSTGAKTSNKTNEQCVYSLIEEMAKANPDYFKAKETVKTEIKVVGGSLKVTSGTKDVYNVKANSGDTVQLQLTNVDSGSTVQWASDNATVATVENGLVTFTGTAGTANITATVSTSARAAGTTYTATFNVYAQETDLPTSEKTITLTVGGTATVEIPNEDLSGIYPTDDQTIATASVVYKSGTEKKLVKATSITSGNEYYISDGKGNYLTLSNNALGNTTDISKATKWTVQSNNSGYRIYSGSTYLRYNNYSLTTSSRQNQATIWSYDGSTGFYYNYYNYYSYYICFSNSSWTVSTSATNYGAAYTQTTEELNKTTITFTGHKAGTTYVTIGKVRYTINVVAEDLSKAADLPIQLWITNVSLDVTGVTTATSSQFNDYNNGGYAYYILAKAADAYGENGVPLMSLVPPAIKNKAVTEFDDRDATYAIWKGTVLNTTTGLQKYWWTDMTKAEGRIEYQYVRYYGGAWAVSPNGVDNWTEVTGEGSTASPTSCKEQLIAYYMQRTDVTQEVITDVVDWGNTTDKWAENNPTQYVVLDFAVAYPDGTYVPNVKADTSPFPVSGKSVYFHCSESDTNVVAKDSNNNYYRRIGLINGIDTTGYEIYMITITPTSDTITEQITNSSTALSTSIKINYKGTEKVIWVDAEDNLPSKFRSDDAKFHSISGEYNYSVGGNAQVPGLEIYQRQGMLVTYYLRPVVTKDSLTVHYRMQSSTADFYSYNINVISGTFFKENIGLGDPTIGRLANGNVENDQNVEQWVTSDLSTMPAIGAEYRYANYKCVSVVRSEDGKDVYIYYTFTKDVSFVIDFGSKLEITPIQVSANLATANITGMTVTTGVYGDITFDSNYNIIYTPKTILRGEETFTVVYKGTNLTTGEGGTATFTISIIPASTVLYEDNLIKFENGWETVGTAASDRTQSTDKLGDGKTYGYDTSYANDTTYSGGSAMTATVNGSATASASFTFTGTGFDLISETGTGTGVIFLDIYSGTETDVANRIKRWVVDTYYGYAYEVDKDNPWLECVWTYGVDKKWHVTRTPVAAEGTSEVVPQNPSEGTTFKTYEPNYTWTKTDKGTLKQIPVINFKDLGEGWGTYTVVITAKYNAFFDHTGAGSYTVCIDGVRIYNTLEDSSIYKEDGEYDPEFIEIRDKLINSEDVSGNVNGAAFIDAIGKTNKSDLIRNYGPNNEVYLAADQTITFTLTSDNVAKLMLGLKAPNGASGVTVTVNGKTQTTITLGTATDMYYQIYSAASGEKTYNIVINNTGSALVSVTTLKVTHTGNSAATQSLLTVNAGLIAEAKAVMLSLIQPEVPVFTPERFEASWTTVTLFRNSVHALVVRTSTDVDHITVDGKEITTFYYAAAFEGWGRNRKLVKYKVFTLFLGNDASTGDYEVVAFDAEGVASEVHIATLTGKTGVGKFN